MVTRFNRDKQIKIKRSLKNLSILLLLIISLFFIIYLIIDYSKSPSTDIKIMSKWHECDQYICSYKVSLKNTSEKSDSAYLKVYGTLIMSGAIKSHLSHNFYQEKIVIKLNGLQEKIISGNVKVKDNNSHLNFNILPL